LRDVDAASAGLGSSLNRAAATLGSVAHADARRIAQLQADASAAMQAVLNLSKRARYMVSVVEQLGMSARATSDPVVLAQLEARLHAAHEFGNELYNRHAEIVQWLQQASAEAATLAQREKAVGALSPQLSAALSLLRRLSGFGLQDVAPKRNDR
jgi:DNA repair ATPase RecN